jgi:hypothetical protein
MDKLEIELVELTLTVHMLKRRHHVLSNDLMSAPEEDKDRIALTLDAIDEMIGQKNDEINNLARFITRPIHTQ